MAEDIKLPELGELTFPQWQAWLAKYDTVLGRRDRRISQLEDALKELLSLGEWGLNDLARTVAREALEEKEGA
jgi:hypothetical protein